MWKERFVIADRTTQAFLCLLAPSHGLRISQTARSDDVRTGQSIDICGQDA